MSLQTNPPFFLQLQLQIIQQKANLTLLWLPPFHDTVRQNRHNCAFWLMCSLRAFDVPWLDSLDEGAYFIFDGFVTEGPCPLKKALFKLIVGSKSQIKNMLQKNGVLKKYYFVWNKYIILVKTKTSKKQTTVPPPSNFFNLSWHTHKASQCPTHSCPQLCKDAKIGFRWKFFCPFLDSQISTIFSIWDHNLKIIGRYLSWFLPCLRLKV